MSYLEKATLRQYYSHLFMFYRLHLAYIHSDHLKDINENKNINASKI